jgi:hypothetical protein
MSAISPPASVLGSPPDQPWAPSPRKRVDPNPHPYAIRTASSALLSRSGSSASQASARHFYLPASPGPSPNRPAHRFTRSLDSAEGEDALRLGGETSSPRPLPPPPPGAQPPAGHITAGPISAAPGDNTTPVRRTRRAETLPPVLSEHDDITLDTDLPPDPKIWTPAQLASYLITALRVQGGADPPLAPAVAREVAAFINAAGIAGRAFLRLNEEDLEG